MIAALTLLLAGCYDPWGYTDPVRVLVPPGPIDAPAGAAKDAPAKGARAQPAGRPPNVVFIVWDTVRADKLALYGNPRDNTPRLSAFAKDAVVYDRAISPGVWTLPSHASMFTGLPVSAHGVGDRRKHLDDEFVTLAEVLKAGGYDTWAFSANPFIGDATNMVQGFDKVEHPWTGKWKGRSEDLQKTRSIDEASTRTKGEDGSWNYRNVGRVAEWALLDHLSDRKGDRPFLAFINYMEAHATRSPALPARAAVMDDAMSKRSLEIDQRTRKQHAWMVDAATYDDAELEIVRRIYEASVFELDHDTGALLDALRAKGALDNTIVVLTADHGETLGEHGLFGHQLGIWNALTRVPMVVWYPPGLEPARVADPTSTAELYRIVLELTGVDVPERGRPGLDTSRYAGGVVTEYTEPMRSTLKTLHDLAPTYDLTPWDQSWTAIERGPHKLLRGSRAGTQLYDVLADRDEQRALSDGAVSVDLSQRLDAWYQTFTAFDFEGAKEVKGQIDEDPRKTSALRELGYVE